MKIRRESCPLTTADAVDAEVAVKAARVAAVVARTEAVKAAEAVAKVVAGDAGGPTARAEASRAD